MLKMVARSVALGVVAAGAILAGSGIASADPAAGPGDLTHGSEPSVPVDVPSAVIDASQPENPTAGAAHDKYFVADSFSFGVER